MQASLCPVITPKPAPTPRRASRPSTGARHDCGPLGMLTVAEIAARAGSTENAIRIRLAKGITGPKLCEASGRCRTYYCGPRHGYLSAKQIAAIVGCSPTAVHNRIRAGRSGLEIIAPKWTESSKVRKPTPPRRHVLVAAFKIADDFPASLPTVKQIQAIRPMSKHHAAIWRQAIATARGLFDQGRG